MTARRKLSRFLNQGRGRDFILWLIVINAVLIGLETYPAVARSALGFLHGADRVILGLFTVEILLRMYASGSARAYVRDSWNLFDFTIVAVCYLPFSGSYIAVARILRVLRVLRAMSLFPDLRRIVGSLLGSLPGMGHIAFLLVILIYIYAVVGTFLFREVAPELFGSLHVTALTLFQVVTLEGWNEIMKPVLAEIPWAWVYFVSFIFMGTFVVFNLFVGVIVSNLESTREREDSDSKGLEKRLLKEIRSLRRRR